jgi:hypothetical protein
MSIFASRIQRTIAVPFDEPHTVTIQRLAGRALERARLESAYAASEYLRRMGGAQFRKELAEIRAAAVSGDNGAAKVAEVAASPAADPLTKYDRRTVLLGGVKGWTYEEAPTEETLDDLSDEAADWLAREILTLTLPNGAEKKTSS